MKHTARSLAVLATFFASAAALAQPEVEPNNVYSSAGAPTGIPTTRTGTITAANDVDWYAVTVPAGSSLRIRAIPTSHTCSTSDLLVTLANASGIAIAVNDDAPGMFLCPELHPSRDSGVVNLAGGTYYVGVNNINGATNIAYQLVVELAYVASPLSPAFTYQGVLNEDGVPANGPRNFAVTLWDHAISPNGENMIGTPVQINGVEVTNGLFTFPLNFGPNAFNGVERYLQIEVARPGYGHVLIGPRQKLTTTPHAAYAMKADSAQSAAVAGHAETANSAGTANQANFCTIADSAWQAPWSGITNMPPAFADGTDDDGPWNSNGTTLWYSGGSVVIGNTNASGFMLAVNGTAAKNGGGSWSVFCDSRLKHDIAPLSGTLDKLLGLRGYTFQYNQNAVEKNLALPGTQIGLMAEEVERVFPDWVEKDADGYRYVTERATTALMVEALRDLRSEKDAALADKQAQIDGLRNANAALEERLRRLEERLPR